MGNLIVPLAAFLCFDRPEKWHIFFLKTSNKYKQKKTYSSIFMVNMIGYVSYQFYEVDKGENFYLNIWLIKDFLYLYL